MEYIIIISVLAFCGWICYQIQKRIGEEQAREWKQFVLDNPQYFHNPTEAKRDNEQKKST